MTSKDLGLVTAYAYAVSQGYTGTEEEFAELMASYATVAEEAAESAAEAAASATAAVTSETNAAASAASATQSATAAGQSASSASGSAVQAQASATAAGQSATQAAGSATAAGQSATAAAGSASQAAASETAAGASATAAAGSATSASESATAAAGSATEADASADRAQEILDSIPEDYSELSDDVADLKSAITDIEKGQELQYVPELINLLDPTQLIADKYINPNTGAESSHTGYYATAFLPVRKGVTYFVAGCAGTNNAYYDTDKVRQSGNILTAGELSNTGTFTASADGYVRFTITSATFTGKSVVTSNADAYRAYMSKYDYSYMSPANAVKIDHKALGAASRNLFQGGSNYGTFNSSTGALSYNPSRLMTPFIAISGTVYWYLDTEVLNYCLYILEYDTNKAFLKYTTTNGKPIGMLVLSATTKYIRINSGGQIQNMMSPAEYDQILYVTDNFADLNKFLPTSKVTTPATVSEDFFRESVTFRHSYVRSAITAYQDDINASGYDFVMPIVTDVHSIDSEAYNMLSYMAETGVADVCFNLGDNIPDHYDDGAVAVAFHKGISAWSRPAYAQCGLYVLRGNHDNNPVDGNDKDDMISNKQYYNLYNARVKPGYAGTDLNYGYLDFEQSKIRVIWLDSGDIYDDSGAPLTSGYNVAVGQDQVTWFIDKALDFSDKPDKSAWSVITTSHARLSQLAESLFNNVLYAFINGESTSGTFTKSFPDTGNTIEITYNADFTSQGAMEYICHVNGHNHDDVASLMGDTNRYDIDVACDNREAHYYVDGVRTAYTRTAGTIEEHLMDTLCLDKANRKVIMRRLGVGSDREFAY